MPPKKKPPATSQQPAATTPALPPVKTATIQAELAFIRSLIVIHPKLSTVINPDRERSFAELVQKIETPETHTKLLLLAHQANDAEAMRAVLRANKFLTDHFEIDHCLKFLSKWLYSLNKGEDKTSKAIYEKLSAAFNQALSIAERQETLATYLTSTDFDLSYLQEAAVARAILSSLSKTKQLATVLTHHAEQLLPHACQHSSTTLLQLCATHQIFPNVSHIALIGKHSPLAYYYALNLTANPVEIQEQLLRQWNPDCLTNLDDVCVLELLIVCCHLNTEEIAAVKMALQAHLSAKNILSLLDQLLSSELTAVAFDHAQEIGIEPNHKQLQSIISKALSGHLFNKAVTTFTGRFEGFSCLWQMIDKFFTTLSSANDKSYVRQEYSRFFHVTLSHLKQHQRSTQDTTRQQLDILLSFIAILFIQTDYLDGLQALGAQFPDCITRPIPDHPKINGFGFTQRSLLTIALHSPARATVIYLFEQTPTEQIQDITDFSSALFERLVNAKPINLALIIKCLSVFNHVFCSFTHFRKLLDILVLNPTEQDPSAVTECLRLLTPYTTCYFKNPLFNFYLPATEKFNAGELEKLRQSFKLDPDQLVQAVTYERRAVHCLEGINSITELAIRKTPLFSTAAGQTASIINAATQTDVLANLTDTLRRRMLFLNNTQQHHVLQRELVAVSTLHYNYVNYARLTGVDKGEKYDLLTFLYFYDLTVLVELALILHPNLNLYDNTVKTDMDLFELICKRHHDGMVRILLEYCYNRDNKDQYALRPDLILPTCSPKYYYHLYCGFAEIKQDREIDKTNFCALATDGRERSRHYTQASDLAKLQLITHMDWILAPSESEYAELVETFIKQVHEEPYPPTETKPASTTGLTKLPRLNMLNIAIAANDSFLIMTAIKYQHQGVVPAERREDCINVLFTCPNKPLADKLALRSEDILRPRDDTAAGYPQRSNGFSILLSDLETAINHRWVKSAIRCLGLLHYLADIVDPLHYPLTAFLSAAARLHHIATALSDKVFIVDYCDSLLQSGKFSLDHSLLAQPVVAFLQTTALNEPSTETLRKPDTQNYLALLRQSSFKNPQSLIGLKKLWSHITLDTDPTDIDWLLQIAILQNDMALLQALYQYAKTRPYSFDLANPITELADPQPLTHFQRLGNFIDAHPDQKRQARSMVRELLKWGDASKAHEEQVLPVLKKLMVTHIHDFSQWLGKLKLSAIGIKKLLSVTPSDNIDTTVALVKYYHGLYPNDKEVLAEQPIVLRQLAKRATSLSSSLKGLYLDALSQHSLSERLALFDTLSVTHLISMRKMTGSLSDTFRRVLNDAIDHKTQYGQQSFQVSICQQLDRLEQQITLARIRIPALLEALEKTPIPTDLGTAKARQRELHSLLLGLNRLAEQFNKLECYSTTIEQQQGVIIAQFSGRIKEKSAEITHHVTALEKEQQEKRATIKAEKKAEQQSQLRIAQQQHQKIINEITQDMKEHSRTLEDLRKSIITRDATDISQRFIRLCQTVEKQRPHILHTIRINAVMAKELNNEYQKIMEGIVDFEYLLEQANNRPDVDDEAIVVEDHSDDETVRAHSPAAAKQTAPTTARPRYYPGWFSVRHRENTAKTASSYTQPSARLFTPPRRAATGTPSQHEQLCLAQENWHLQQRLLQEQLKNQEMAYYQHYFFNQQFYLQTAIAAQQIAAIQQATLIKKQEMLASAQSDLEKSHGQHEQIQHSQRDMGEKLNTLALRNFAPFPKINPDQPKQHEPQPIMPIAVLKPSPYYSDDSCVYLEITFNKDIISGTIEACKNLDDPTQECPLFIADPRIRAGLCCIYFEKIIGEQGYTWIILQNDQVFSNVQVFGAGPCFARLVEGANVSTSIVVHGIHDLSYWEGVAATPSLSYSS